MARSAQIYYTEQSFPAFARSRVIIVYTEKRLRIVDHYCVVFEQVVSWVSLRLFERPIVRLGTLDIWHRHIELTPSWPLCIHHYPGTRLYIVSYGLWVHDHMFDRIVTTRTSWPRIQRRIHQRPMICRLSRAVDASEQLSYQRKWQFWWHPFFYGGCAL